MNLTHPEGTVIRRRRIEMPEELRANILIAAENLKEALKPTNQTDVHRYVLNALRALDKELNK